MKATQKVEDDPHERLARYFFIAYLAYHHGVTFKTAEGYVSGENEIGGLWLFLADIAMASITGRTDSFFESWEKKVEKEETKPGKVIPFGRVD